MVPIAFALFPIVGISSATVLPFRTTSTCNSPTGSSEFPYPGFGFCRECATDKEKLISGFQNGNLLSEMAVRNLLPFRVSKDHDRYVTVKRRTVGTSLRPCDL